MKRLIWMACVAGLAAGCGSKTPTSPSNTPTVFTVALSPANEVPPVTNDDKSGSGTATITVHTVKDSAGNVTSGTIDFSVTLTGFPAGTSLTAAHIHPGASGASGSPLVDTGLTTGDNVVLANGSGSFTKNGIAPNVSDLQNILANPAGFYFNVHTALNRAGAARGQL